MQDRPICFQCDQSIQTNAEMIFEAPCGHATCSSAVFHPICLFDWRDRRTSIVDYLKGLRRRWMEEHGMKEEE